MIYKPFYLIHRCLNSKAVGDGSCSIIDVQPDSDLPRVQRIDNQTIEYTRIATLYKALQFMYHLRNIQTNSGRACFLASG